MSWFLMQVLSCKYSLQ